MKKFLIGFAGAFALLAAGSLAWGGPTAPNALASAGAERVGISQVALSPSGLAPAAESSTTALGQKEGTTPVLLAWAVEDDCGCENDGDDDDSSIGVGVGVGVSAGGTIVVTI